MCFSTKGYAGKVVMKVKTERLSFMYKNIFCVWVMMSCTGMVSAWQARATAATSELRVVGVDNC